MDTNMYACICQLVLGPSGAYWPEWDGLEDLYVNGLYRSYYASKSRRPGIKTIRKYCSGVLPPPRGLKAYYAGQDGLSRMLDDMDGLIVDSVCRTRSLMIQQNIHTWSKERIGDMEMDRLEQYYIAEDPDDGDIAIYIAMVLHYVLQRV